jgi:hypothetical protein
MHSLVRRYLKTGIGFLTLGVVLGLWMMIERELLQRFPSPYVVSAHTHAILVGFVMMMILGVALWLFPRPSKDDTRYSPKAAEVAYWLVGGGTLLRVIAEISRASVDAVWFARGGYGSNRIAEAILANLPERAGRKVYLGYSDAGFLHAGLHKAGLEVAWGPMPQDALRSGGGEAIHRALNWIVRRDPAALEPALDGPASGMTLNSRNPISLHHPTKSAPV